MKKSLILLVSLFLFFNFHTLNAQELPSIIPPSPNAASLGQYADIPVSNYTGSPNISIPLYAVKSGSIEVPITLNYNGTGIKVAEEASWVGLGWNLSAGGVITRQVRHLDDFGGYGYYTTDKFPLATEYNLPYYADPENPYPENNEFYNPINMNHFDAEPDIYYYNFLGKSGKIVLRKPSEDGYVSEIYGNSMDQNDLKFKYTRLTQSWEIIDGNGTTYSFGQNAKENTINYSFSSDLPIDESDIRPYAVNTDLDGFDTSWYITKVESIQNDEVVFNYENTEHEILGQVHSSELLFDLLDIVTLASQGSGELSSSLQGNYNLYSANQQINKDVYLKSIEFANGNLHFLTGDREDMRFVPGTPKAQRLESIELIDLNLNHVKKMDFSYSYMNESWMNSIDKEEWLRLQLDSVQESVTKEDGTVVTIPPHTFLYNESSLPKKTSYAIDFWGYYNGVSNGAVRRTWVNDNNNSVEMVPKRCYNNYVKMLSPFYSSVAENSVFIEGANREVNSAKAKSGILTTIEYPLSGKTFFEYESNDYYSENHQLYESAIETYGAFYEYQFAPVLENGSFTLDHYTQVYVDVYIENFNANLDDSYIMLYKEGDGPIIIVNGSSTIPGEDYYDISYRVVLPPGNYHLEVDYEGSDAADMYISASFIGNTETSKKKGAGLRIKSITALDNNLTALKSTYNYETEGGESTGRLLSPLNYFYNQSIINQNYSIVPGSVDQHVYVGDYLVKSSSSVIPLGNSAQGSAIGYDQVSVSRTNSLGENLGKTEYFYRNEEEVPVEVFLPGVPNFTHQNNGQLLSEITYNAQNDTVKEKFLEYNKNEDAHINLKALKTYSFHGSVNPFGNPSTEFRFYDVYSDWWYLENTIETIYDENGNNPITTTIDYEYENIDHKNLTRTSSTNSKGETIVTNNEYPHDYPTGTTMTVSDFETMKDDNIVNPVIKQTSSSNGNILSTQINTYKKWDINSTQYDSSDDVYLPEFIKTAKSDYDLEDRIVFLKYDNQGNPLEVSKADGTHIIYIWGYNQTLPIVKIENKTYEGMPYDLLNLFDQIQAMSDSEFTEIEENDFRLVMEELYDHSYLGNALITTFTYDPLIGVTSITDPRGNVVYYKYDEFNRLKYIKDKDLNILSKNDYNYANQN